MMIDTLASLPKEPLVYEAGGIIFASALAGFSHAMRRMLYVIGRRGIWIFPYLGALLMLLAVGLHAYASFFLLPFADLHGPQVFLEVYRFRFIALLAMLASSILTVAGGLLFWLMMTGFSIRSRGAA
jgi:hypothetical protein